MPPAETWQRLHPLTPALRSLQLFYVLILAIAFRSLGGAAAESSRLPAGGDFSALVATIMLAAFLFGILVVTLSYLRFRYRVTEDSLVITHGVLFRRRRVIPRSRIQNVDLRAGPLQQLLGVAAARIETAGGGDTEATLSVVSRAEGVRLRETLVRPATEGRLRAPAAATSIEPTGVTREGPTASQVHQTAEESPATAPRSEPAAPAAPPPTSVRRLSLLDLAIAGATSNRVGVLVGALFGGDFIFGFMPTDRLLRRVLPPELINSAPGFESLVDVASRDFQAFLAGAAALALVFGLVGWAISVLASALRYFDFTLTERSGELRVTYGLFTRREKGFRRGRVQNLQIEESILRRWLGLASIRVQTAGYGPATKQDERMETLTPIARSAEIREYLSTVWPDFDWNGVAWRPSHPRSLRRMFVRRAAVIVPIALVLTAVVHPAGLLVLLALIPARFLAALHYRHRGHFRSEAYVLTREGFWNRRTYIVPIRKIQALHLKQSPFQRRLGLGTLTLETAGNPYDWREGGAVDLGADYGFALAKELAGDVTATGLTF